jgi:hypothetical protein
MTQIADTIVSAEAMVRSRAWREGYESFRLRLPPDYAHRGRHTLAYEYGRQTAAWLKGRDEPLPRVPANRPTRHSRRRWRRA